jgi:hypothetical protein
VYAIRRRQIERQLGAAFVRADAADNRRRKTEAELDRAAVCLAEERPFWQ